MFTKTFLIVLLATLSVSLAKFQDEQDELVHQVLGTGTTLMKEFSKVVADDPDKLSLDLNSLYKKYEVAAKAEQARSYVQSQFKRGVEYTNEYLKKADIASEEQLKKYVEIIKKEDPVLAEKVNKFYEKTCEVDRISEDIIKYILDVDKLNNSLEKFKGLINPFIHKAAEGVKKFETIVVEHIPKKNKK